MERSAKRIVRKQENIPKSWPKWSACGSKKNKMDLTLTGFKKKSEIKIVPGSNEENDFLFVFH